MNSDSIFHQCFTQKGLLKSQSDCSLELKAQYKKTLERNGSFRSSIKSREKEKIRRHLPVGTGEFSVGCIDLMCERCEKGSFFRLYYPIEKTDIYKRDKQWPLWLPRKQYGVGYASFIGVNKTVFGKMFNWMGGDVYVPAIWQHFPLNTGKQYPVVIFSHGIGGNRTCNTTVCCELASQGYIVASVEHRDGSASMTFQLKENNQRTVNVSHSNNHHMHRTHSYSEEWMPFDRSPPRWDDYDSRNKQVHKRADECILALDVLTDLNKGETIFNQLGGNFNLKLFKGLLDMTNVAMVGHSFGGSTTVSTLSKDKRFKVGVMLDGWMHPLDEEVYKMISQPLLMINMETFQWQENVDQMRRLQGQEIDRPMITIRGTCHQSVTDFQFLVKKPVGLIMDVRHSLSPKIAIDVSNKATLGFIRKHLGQTDKETYDAIISGEHENVVAGPLITRERPV